MELEEILKKLDIKYKSLKHEPLFTVSEAQKIKDKIKGVGCKNLFLKDKKKRYFLLVAEDMKKVDLKLVAKLVHVNSLSFAKEEELKNILNLTAGSVTPLGIINDKDNKVIVVIDKDLKNKTLLVHPNINTETWAINFIDLEKIFVYFQHDYILVDI